MNRCRLWVQELPRATLRDMSADLPILLQKSKVATPRIFREDKRWETIADSYTLNRVAEIAGEFDARGHVPPHLYTEDAPTARRIFDHLRKTTFATVSYRFPTSRSAATTDEARQEETSAPRMC